jgi:hypothetical protein
VVLLVQQLLGNVVIMIVEATILVTPLLQGHLQEAPHHGAEIVDVEAKAVEIPTMVVKMATTPHPRHPPLLLLGNNKLPPTPLPQRLLVDMVATLLLDTTLLILRVWVPLQDCLALASVLCCSSLLAALHPHLQQVAFRHLLLVLPHPHLLPLTSLHRLPREIKQVD